MNHRETQIKHSLSNSKQSGVVLLSVLGIVFLIGVVVTLFLELSMKKIREQAASYAVDDLRIPAYSALEITLSALNEFKQADGRLTAPSQGWGNPMEYSEIIIDEDLTVEVSIEDETGKFPLFSNDSLLIENMFVGMGFDVFDAQVLRDSLFDWMDANDAALINGAEEDFYERMDPPYKPPNRNIASYDELRLIQGFKELFYDENGVPNEMYQKFVAATSFHNNTKTVNRKTANSSVEEILIEGFHIDSDHFNPNYNIPNPPPILANGISVLRVTVDVTRADSHFILTSIVDVTGTQPQNAKIRYPFNILQRAENQPIE